MITCTDNRQPLGIYTWVAILRDGTQINEFNDEEPQKSFDVLSGLDVSSVHLCPARGVGVYTRILVGPGEYVTKKWIRTFTMNLDSGEQVEQPIIDAYTLHSNKPVNHFTSANGATRITTDEDLS